MQKGCDVCTRMIGHVLHDTAAEVGAAQHMQRQCSPVS
jgi:hypothetical protein